LIASIDVEQKARAKDGRSKGVEGQTSANMVHQAQSHGKVKGKVKQNQNNKLKKTTTFKKKKKNKEDEGCFVSRRL
jgi:acyl-CoA hydrolase